MVSLAPKPKNITISGSLIVTQRPSPGGGQPLIRHYVYKITKWHASTLHKSSWLTLTITTIYYFIHHPTSSLSELILNCFTALRSLLTLRHLLFFHYITWMSEYRRQPPLAPPLTSASYSVLEELISPNLEALNLIFSSAYSPLHLRSPHVVNLFYLHVNTLDIIFIVLLVNLKNSTNNCFIVLLVKLKNSTNNLVRLKQHGWWSFLQRQSCHHGAQWGIW